MIRSQIPILALFGLTSSSIVTAAAQAGGTVALGYESVYVDAGVEAAGPSLQPLAEVAYGGFLGGFWANLPLDHESEEIPDEHNYYVAYSFELTETFALGFGGTVYYFPQDFAGSEHTVEANLVLGVAVPCSPALGYDYDLDLEQHRVTLAVEEVFAVAERVELVFGALAGWVQAGDVNADAAGSPEDSYLFAEGIVDIAWQVTDVLAVSAGPRVAANNNGAANPLGREQHVWWGVLASANF